MDSQLPQDLEDESMCLAKPDDVGTGGISKHMQEVVVPLYLQSLTDLESHLILECKINSIKAYSLVDSRATGIFVHPQFAHECKAEIRAKIKPR